MNEYIRQSLLRGYENTKLFLKSIDEHEIIIAEPIEHYLEDIGRIIAYYEREYRDVMRHKSKKIGTVYEFAYVSVKSLLHLYYISTDEDKLKKFFPNDLRPEELNYGNEILCWHVLVQMYPDFLNGVCQLKDDRNTYTPYCESHFEEMLRPVVQFLCFSRNRLGEITPIQIELIFNILLNVHKNQSAELLYMLLRRSAFMTFMTDYSEKEGVLALMYCDLDKFKQINEGKGINRAPDNTHETGDKILLKVAKILSDICNKYKGIAARGGGEEFWLAFHYPANTDPTIPKQDLYDIFGEIRKELEKEKRPNADPVCMADKDYKEFLTISAAGGIVPKTSGYINREISDWLKDLDHGVQSVKERKPDGSRGDDFKFVELSLSKSMSDS